MIKNHTDAVLFPDVSSSKISLKEKTAERRLQDQGSCFYGANLRYQRQWRVYKNQSAIHRRRGIRHDQHLSGYRRDRQAILEGLQGKL